MSRPGAILIPLLAGFLLTVAVVTWRCGWWQQHDARLSGALPAPRIEPRRSHLRIVYVEISGFARGGDPSRD